MADDFQKQVPSESKPEYLEKIKFNLPVEVEIKKGIFQGNYLSKVLKIVNKRQIFFEMPKRDGKVMKLWPKTFVYINFYFDNDPGAVYTFSGRILEIMSVGNNLVFVLAFPKKVVRIQRRSYVRIDVSIPFEFQSYLTQENEDELVLIPAPKFGYTLDLSGGGVFLRTPFKLTKGQFIQVKFSLKENDFDIKSKIMRVVEVKRGRKVYYKYGVLFMDINESIRRSIISYVFDVEREQIKKKRMLR